MELEKMAQHTEHVDAKVEIARMGGAAGLGVIYGLTLNEWVAVATIFYLCLQIILITPRALRIIAEAAICVRKKISGEEC